MSHYQTLGITENATADEIKKAYRKLASQHHPDKGGDTAKFQEIQIAYDVLSDINKKAQYDNRNTAQPFKWEHFGDDQNININDIFRNFGFPGGHDPFSQFRHQHAPRRNKDLRINLQISLKDTLVQTNKTISVQTTNGERQTVEVSIPKGITTDTQIKYTGLGDNLFNTLPRGDLYVNIVVTGDPTFEVKDLDLHTKFTVNCLEAIVGTEYEITTIDDRKFLLTIPAGTQPGTKFRIAGQGLYRLNTEIRGDLYAEMAVSIPKNLPQEQLDFIKNLNI